MKFAYTQFWSSYDSPKGSDKNSDKKNWHWQMRRQIRTPESLREWLKQEGIYPRTHADLLEALRLWEDSYALWDSHFRFGASPYYLELADWGDPYCPVLRQILPSPAEFIPGKKENWDPLAEERHSPLFGLTHRYPDRVLWYLSHSCPVYCRFCMRKRKVAQPQSAPKKKNGKTP